MHWRIERRFFRTRAGILLLVVTAAILLIALVASLRPLPGRYLTMATGPPGSAYELAGERYREILARNGVHLKLAMTEGAAANAALLRDPRSRVSVGFVQAGGVSEADAQQLVSLGTVFYEPLWVFCRCPRDEPLFRNDSNRRVSIGSVGSATRPLALRLLALNGIDAAGLRLLAYTPEQAERSLLAHEIDIAIMLSAWDSPVVQRLTRAPDITVRDFPRADAYVAVEPTLSKLILPRGVADFAHDRPPSDIALIASKASLAARKDVHPALQYLLVSAAIEVHSRPGIFQRAGEFPAPEAIDLPLSDDARHTYKTGPSFLQRVLPFWLAEFVQRALILIIPVVGIIYPLWSLLPKIYRWQIQRRLFHVYADLMAVERQLRQNPSDRTLIRQLDELDRRVLELRLPLAFGEMIYNLKAHILALRQRAREDVEHADGSQSTFREQAVAPRAAQEISGRRG